jgi:signal transduction histidine kinase
VKKKEGQMLTYITEILLGFSAIVLGAMAVSMFINIRNMRRLDEKSLREKMQQEINSKRRSF